MAQVPFLASVWRPEKRSMQLLYLRQVICSHAPCENAAYPPHHFHPAAKWSSSSMTSFHAWLYARMYVEHLHSVIYMRFTCDDSKG